jgi:hypothetical protein
MEVKFLSPFKVCYLIGLFNLIIAFIILIIFSNTKCNSELLFCKEGENILDVSSIFNSDFIYILIDCLLISLLIGLIKYRINSVLNKYNIYYTIQLYQFNSIYDYILIFSQKGIRNDNFINIILIIFFILIIFDNWMHLIYNEIIELNFCGLSENIKTNIQKRAEEDLNMGNNNEDLKIKFELEGGFSSNLDENRDSEVNENELNME